MITINILPYPCIVYVQSKAGQYEAYVEEPYGRYVK